MRTIVLTRGLVAKVDDNLFEWLNQWKWHALKIKQKFYAGRRDYADGKEGDFILMHRQILKLAGGEEGDHEDGDGLNNQIENLRRCTHQQNLWKRRFI